MRFALDSIRLIIRRIGESFRSTDDGDDNNAIDIKLDKALEAMTKAADKIPELAKKLSDSEKALAQDFATEDSARGGIQKAIGEDI